jgi:hypothetical protein
MANRYSLSGTFVECCDCFTICPCWVADTPDEDHCSGLYVWTFDAGSKVAGLDVGSKSMAAATFHGLGGPGQAVLFVDETLTKVAQNALIEAFSGKRGGPLEDLAKLLGTLLDAVPAKISTSFAASNFEVSVTVSGSQLALAKGKPKLFKHEDDPLILDNSALEAKLGIRGVTEVQDMEKLSVSVAALPGGPYQFAGRSGMRGSFVYR